jgi:hypothetical protein
MTSRRESSIFTVSHYEDSDCDYMHAFMLTGLLMACGAQVRRDELDLLYRVFDTNRNGFLELGEVVKHQEHLDKSFATDQAIARAASGIF